jgi:hypothetical protein
VAQKMLVVQVAGYELKLEFLLSLFSSSRADSRVPRSAVFENASDAD